MYLKVSISREANVKKPTGVILTASRFPVFSRLNGKLFHVINTVKRRILAEPRSPRRELNSVPVVCLQFPMKRFFGAKKGFLQDNRSTDELQGHGQVARATWPEVVRRTTKIDICVSKWRVISLCILI